MIQEQRMGLLGEVMDHLPRQKFPQPPGSARGFLRNLEAEHLPWREAGVESAGNGAFMPVAREIEMNEGYRPRQAPG